MSHLDVVTLKELWDKNTDGYLPILLEIYNPDLSWTEAEKKAYGQEDCQVRFIADENKVIYKGKTYLPCAFNYQASTTDGSKISNATITITALDTRIKKLLRSILLPSEVKVTATFGKQEKDDKVGFIYKFVELNSVSFTMSSASSTKTTATFNLEYDRSLQQNVPYSKATRDRVPATQG